MDTEERRKYQKGLKKALKDGKDRLQKASEL
jgi:hypothetical protein